MLDGKSRRVIGVLLAIELLAAFAQTQGMEELPFEVRPTTWTYGVVAALLMLGRPVRMLDSGAKGNEG